MSNRWSVIIASVAGMIAVGAAAAADIKPIYKAPPVSSMLPYWSGVYLGAHTGGLFGGKIFTSDPVLPDGMIGANSPVRGWFGGLQTGYNYQINWLVLGVEGEFTWARSHGNFPCSSVGDQACSADPQWIGSLAGRIGAAFGPALFYLKGGAAWAHNTYSGIATCAALQAVASGGTNAPCGEQFAASETRPGWLVGVGGEYRFAPEWSVKVEYDYLRFGTRSISFTDSQGDLVTELVRQDMHLIKAGVNYHFGNGDSNRLSAYAYQPNSSPRGGVSVRRPKPTEDDKPSSDVLAFSGVDIGKYSLDGWAGVLIAPAKDLDTSGPRVWFLGSSGIYKYFGEGTTFRGTFTSGEALAGYGFEGNNYSINVLGGLNAINHMVSPFDPENKVQGTALGIKGRLDAYVTPTPGTMLYGEAEYSSAFKQFYATGKFGVDVANGKQIYFGPMASVFGDERFHQWRLGGHVSNLKFGKVQVDISAGYANDSVVGTGAFAHIELSTPLN
jgi:outer membrane immunogenic protein